MGDPVNSQFTVSVIEQAAHAGYKAPWSSLNPGTSAAEMDWITDSLLGCRGRW